MNPPVHPVDEHLPLGRLTALGLRHVLVMYVRAPWRCRSSWAARSASRPIKWPN